MISTAASRKTAAAVRCLLCGKAAPSPLCCLGPQHAARHAAAGRIQTVRRGQLIFHAGNVPFALYGILDGTVKVSATTTGGTTLILRVVGAGDILGYRPLLAGEKYAMTAEAIATTRIATIPRDELLAALRRSPDTALWFLAMLARELRISEEQMVAGMHLPVRRRTARLLLTLLARMPARVPQARGGARGPVIDLALSRTELAQMIGVAPETLSRTLRALADEEIIALGGGRAIVIRKVEALRAMARAAATAGA